MAEPTQNSQALVVRKVLIDLSVMTVIGILLAIIGPFGSFQDPLSTRLLSWLGLGYVGYFLYAPIDTIVRRLGPRLDLPEWWLRIAACIIATFPMAAVVWSVPRYPDRMNLPGPAEAIEHYGYVLVIGAFVTGLFFVLGLYQDQNGQGKKEQAEAGQVEIVQTGSVRTKEGQNTVAVSPSFLDRLPPALGSDLIALEMEDHYVRAHTALGSELVLLRMRDAVAELDGLDGAQVHRSWWVARGAVADVKRDGRNIRLVLDGGLEAPVSRANVAMLKDAGWF